MEKEDSYNQTMLESIKSILTANWKRDVNLIKDRNDPKSILLLIDANKLSTINTITVKCDMKLANFPLKYIASIQEYKHEISNKKARKKYNASICDLIKLRTQLVREREELKNEISELIRKEPS